MVRSLSHTEGRCLLWLELLVARDDGLVGHLDRLVAVAQHAGQRLDNLPEGRFLDEC